MDISSDPGIVTRKMRLSVDDAAKTLADAVTTKGLTLFSLVDHSGEAAKVGLVMRPTKLLILGSPKAGTPLMQAAPSVAIDLPLKLLLWEDEGGTARISYNSTEYLAQRHHLPTNLLPNIAGIESIAKLVEE